MRIDSIHAPTLLFTQQVWGSAWSKIRHSVALAAELGAHTVVAHPRSGGRARTRRGSPGASSRSWPRPAW